MIFLSIILLSSLAGYLYYVGGESKESISWANTKVRDFGVPLCAVIAMCILNGWYWIYILCFGAMFGAQTTYFNKKGKDEEWWNWLLCGIAFSIAWIFFTIFISHNWMGFLYRLICTSIFTVIWSESNGNVKVESPGRGFIQIITLPLLTIGG